MPTMSEILERATPERASAALGDLKLVSGDSHVTEPPNCYVDYIDPAFRDTAPRIERDGQSDVWVIPEMVKKISLGFISCAGIPPTELRGIAGIRFEEIYRGGYDAKARIEAQDRDGVAAEIVYPSIGMVLCNHPDAAYKRACFQAYNRWLEEFVAGAPTRVFGVGQVAVRSVEETVEDFVRIKAAGFKGVMMPLDPMTEFDYDDPRFDPVWKAAVELGLPLSFHALTSGKNVKSQFGVEGRSDKIANTQHLVMRANQDLICLLIWGGVFDRFPALKIICVEADAGWAPHFIHRLDHFHDRHRHWSGTGKLERIPSEVFRDNIWLTFQDDWVAFQFIDAMYPQRLLWASDYPHIDSTWPHSREILAERTSVLTEQQKRWVLGDNTVELYGLELG
jgi:predicted TIM-barrel fold metal-dependent hydrolase